jgi:hypothetical protein
MTRNAWLVVLAALAVLGVVMFLPGSGLKTFAEAIAAAEGFGTPGAIPTTRNNPGDLKLGSDDSISTFNTLTDGWNALYHQLSLVVSGASAYYSLDMSIADFAVTWTGNDNPAGWTATVVQYLNANGYPTVSGASPVRVVLA